MKYKIVPGVSNTCVIYRNRNPPAGVAYFEVDGLPPGTGPIYTDGKILYRNKISGDELIQLQNEKQEQNKAALSTWFATHPMQWQDGKFYGVSQDDQNEMSLNLMQYQLAVSAGQEVVLLWHATKEECREFSVEEYTALTLTIAAYVTPFLRLQEQIKAQIYAAQTKEELDKVEIDYEKLT